MRALVKTAVVFTTMVVMAFGTASGLERPLIWVEMSEVEGLIEVAPGDYRIPSAGLTTMRIPIHVQNVDDARTAISNGYIFTGDVTFWALNVTWTTAYPVNEDIACDEFDCCENPAFPWMVLCYSWFDFSTDIVYINPDLTTGDNFTGIGVGVAGLTDEGDGLPADFNDVLYTIEVWMVSGEPGQVLTLDSTYWLPNHYWEWSGVGGDVDWGGPYVFAFEAAAPIPPSITSDPIVEGTLSSTYTYDVDAAGYPAPTFSLTTHPTGMVIDEITGVIIWTPTAAGDFDVTVVASNGVEPDAVQSFVIHVIDPATPPAITSMAPTGGMVGVLYEYDVDAAGYPAPTFSLTTHPTGMVIDEITGVISWMPTAAGDYDVTVVATNDHGEDAQQFVITVVPEGSRPMIWVDVAEIEGLTPDGKIPAGGAVKIVIPIHVLNVGDNRRAISNGYIFGGEVSFYSLSAAWTTAYPVNQSIAEDYFDCYEEPPEPCYSWFDFSTDIVYINPDLTNGDNFTAVGVGVAGLTAQGDGLPANFNDVLYTFQVWNVSGEPGQVLTLDSTWWKPSNYWTWSGVYEEVGWGGPYEFEMETCESVGEIAGFVRWDTLGLAGIPVDLYGSEGLIASKLTDDTGHYSFDGEMSGHYTVSVSTPLGYYSDAETKEVVVCEAVVEVDFDLLRQEVVAEPRSCGYWAHLVNGLIVDDPNAGVSFEDMCQYMDLIRIHFVEHELNPVTVFNVSLADTVCGSRLEALGEAISPIAQAEEIDRARGQLTALLLNTVSGKLAQWMTISEDSATVSQAITYCNELIEDGLVENDADATDIARMINVGKMVPGGMIDLTTPDYAYRHEDELPSAYMLSQNRPNPFNPITEIGFALPHGCHVKLEIFNIVGQRVVTLADRRFEAGSHTLMWDGSNVASGIYLYRLKTDEFVDTKKMVLLK